MNTSTIIRSQADMAANLLAQLKRVVDGDLVLTPRELEAVQLRIGELRLSIDHTISNAQMSLKDRLYATGAKGLR